MKRFLITAAATVLAAVCVPAASSAAVVELGAIPASPLVAPACPSNVPANQCTIILTRVTALETIRDGVAYPTTVKQAGRIVAVTVGLSRLSSNRSLAHTYIHDLDLAYGGTTRIAVSVLRASGAKKLRRWKVIAQSPVFHVQPYLGQIVQLPLPSSLPVLPGDVVALTTPTWAPVLSINLDSKRFAYRQSRTTGCSTPPTTNDAQSPGQTATYSCNYPGTRVEYTATEITNPVAANPIHASDMATSSDQPAWRSRHASGGSGLF